MADANVKRKNKITIERRRRATKKKRGCVLTDRERLIVREVLEEHKAHLGIEDAEKHRQQHEWWENIQPKLDELLPWVHSQKAITDKKQQWWGGIYADLARWCIVNGLKFIIVFLMIAISLGALKALGVMMPWMTPPAATAPAADHPPVRPPEP